MAHDLSSSENIEELCLFPSLNRSSLNLLGQEICTKIAKRHFWQSIYIKCKCFFVPPHTKILLSIQINSRRTLCTNKWHGDMSEHCSIIEFALPANIEFWHEWHEWQFWHQTQQNHVQGATEFLFQLSKIKTSLKIPSFYKCKRISLNFCTSLF